MAKKAGKQFPCHFGNVSTGKNNESIGATISRANIDLDTADDLFAGRQLSIKLTALMEGEDPSQKMLPENNRRELEGVVEVTGYSVKDSSIRAGLKFVKDASSGLRDFAAAEGILTVVKVLGKIESDEDESEE